MTTSLFLCGAQPLGVTCYMEKEAQEPDTPLNKDAHLIALT